MEKSATSPLSSTREIIRELIEIKEREVMQTLRVMKILMESDTITLEAKKKIAESYLELPLKIRKHPTWVEADREIEELIRKTISQPEGE